MAKRPNSPATAISAALASQAPLSEDGQPQEGTPIEEAPEEDPLAGKAMANALPNAAQRVALPDRPKADVIATNAVPFCHQCGRTGDDDRSQCPNLQVPGGECPQPVDPDAYKDLVLSAPGAGVIRTIPLASLVKGHAPKYLPGNVRPEDWKIVHPKLEG